MKQGYFITGTGICKEEKTGKCGFVWKPGGKYGMITERRRGGKKKSVVRKIRKTGAKEKQKSFAKRE